MRDEKQADEEKQLKKTHKSKSKEKNQDIHKKKNRKDSKSPETNIKIPLKIVNPTKKNEALKSNQRRPSISYEKID